MIHIIHTAVFKNESKHSKMGPVRQNPIQRIVRSVHVCALHCGQYDDVYLREGGSLSLTYLLRQLPTYYSPGPTWGHNTCTCLSDRYLERQCSNSWAVRHYLSTKLLISPSLDEFWKSINMWQSYNKRKSVQFIYSHCIHYLQPHHHNRFSALFTKLLTG